MVNKTSVLPGTEWFKVCSIAKMWCPGDFNSGSTVVTLGYVYAIKLKTDIDRQERYMADGMQLQHYTKMVMSLSEFMHSDMNNKFTGSLGITLNTSV